jgi:hypothetical protein
MLLRVFPGLEAKRWELSESAGVATGVEPLEEAPEEADPEVFQKCTYLLPAVDYEQDHSECRINYTTDAYLIGFI